MRSTKRELKGSGWRETVLAIQVSDRLSMMLGESRKHNLAEGRRRDGPLAGSLL